ncbi:MAG TPA: AraC family transcriptional regulator [Planctomycetota bacterium]|nr:AraC family transcriptional regulator [Planctomycetota bacterium]
MSTHGDIAIAAAGYQPYKTTWIDHQFKMHAVGLVASGRGTYRLTSPHPPPTTLRASDFATNGSNTGAAGRTPFGAAGSGVAAQATGAAVSGVATEATPIEPGSMFTVFPGPVFTYGATPGPAWEEYYFIAVGAGVQRWIDFGWFPIDGGVYRLSHPHIAVECYRELLRIQQRAAPGDADRAVTLAERLLIEMYHGRETLEHARQPGESIAAVLAFCRQNFTRPIDFQALAEDHAMSYSSLRQRLKQVTGVPPAQYLIHLRCQKAQALLSDTDLTIKAIGAAVGINDPYAFSRTFKKCVGLAPDLYRRQTAPWSNPTRGRPNQNEPAETRNGPPPEITSA